MEMKQLMPTFASLLLFCIHFTYIFAQSPTPAPIPPPIIPPPTLPPPTLSPPILPPPTLPPPVIPSPIPPQSISPGPAPTGPTNITAILEKAGRFDTLIRLLRITQSGDRINIQLNNSQGLTIFAPDDAAFAKLKSGSLNSYTDEQKSELIQSHIIPSFLSIPQFQTATNPMRTQAGDTKYGQFPLNVTTTGSSLSLTTGFASASVVSTVYTDGQLAVYEVDKVLLPQRFFVAPPPSSPPAPAPVSSKPNKPQPSISSTKPVDSHAVSLIHKALFQASYVFAVLVASWLFG